MPDNIFRGGVGRYSKRKSLLDKILILTVYLGLIGLGAWVFTAILDLVS